MDCPNYNTAALERKAGQHLQREDRGAIQQLRRLGYSNRPEFQRMLREIEAGNVATLIVKDMSRLSCANFAAGMFIEKNFRSTALYFIH